MHCLIRAESAAHGAARLRDALEQAEIREEVSEDRLRVVPGDFTRERFGLSEPAFGGLCERIDAVYHLAASTRLVLSYADIRDTNALGMRPVLDFCIRTRLKHLFFFSTMAIFPEYFCDFSREYSHGRIDDQMPPDLASMKKTFPLGAHRLSLEQARCRARRAVRESCRHADRNFPPSADVACQFGIYAVEQLSSPTDRRCGTGGYDADGLFLSTER